MEVKKAYRLRSLLSSPSRGAGVSGAGTFLRAARFARPPGFVFVVEGTVFGGGVGGRGIEEELWSDAVDADLVRFLLGLVIL
jgi:hypothetical protein